MSIDSDDHVLKSVELARQIQHYLSAHPNAADSVEGIHRWWLARQRYEESLEQVEQALDYLVDSGQVSRRVEADGRVVYARRSRDASN